MLKEAGGIRNRRLQMCSASPCHAVNLTDGCCFQHQLGRSSNTESWIVSRVFAWIGHCWNSVYCKKRGHCREVKLKTTSKTNETMQLINKSIDVLDQYMLPIDRQVHGLKVYFLYLFFFVTLLLDCKQNSCEVRGACRQKSHQINSLQHFYPFLIGMD